jgi:hypothetical protein
VIQAVVADLVAAFQQAFHVLSVHEFGGRQRKLAIAEFLRRFIRRIVRHRRANEEASGCAKLVQLICDTQAILQTVINRDRYEWLVDLASPDAINRFRVRQKAVRSGEGMKYFSEILALVVQNMVQVQEMHPRAIKIIPAR